MNYEFQIEKIIWNVKLILKNGGSIKKNPFGKGSSKNYYRSRICVPFEALLFALIRSMRFSTDGFVKAVLFLYSFKIPLLSYFFLNLFNALSIDSFS